jgi:hypothetical protein
MQANKHINLSKTKLMSPRDGKQRIENDSEKLCNDITNIKTMNTTMHCA